MLIHQITNSVGNFSYNAIVYKNTFWDFHFHANYELIYVIEGSGQIFVNGREELLTKGEAVLIPPYAPHSLRITDSAVWVGVFSEDHISEFAKKRKHAEYSSFHLDIEVADYLHERLFISGKPKKYELISYLYTVCAQLLKNAVEIKSASDSRLAGKILTYISENINSSISMKAAAEALGYEYHYFSDLFHLCFSMNFKGFVNTFRCNKAGILLADKSKSITDIAADCGFGSIRNFNRVFKEQSGYSPSKYRSSL